MAVSNNARLGLGALAAVAIALVVVLLVPRPQPPVVIDTEPEVIAESAPEMVLIAPALDTFRVEADGTSVMAGHAEPFQEVAIIVDGVATEVTTADASGAFVAFPTLGFAAASRALTLVADPKGAAVQGTDTYLIAPVNAPEQAAITEPEPASEQVASAAPQSDPTPKAIEPEVAVAPAILVASPQGVTVLQPSGSDSSPDVLSNVALDSITYDPSGDVLIAGRASAGGFVQVYLDNQPVTTSRILADGNWRTDLPQVDTGVYTLRVDQVSVEGDVISRIETPFQREEPSLIVAQFEEQTETPDFKVAVATVQPGTSLWAIATERFGSGIMYVKVFEANRDRIRNPDLIYPGQVFRIPQVDE